MITLLIQSEGLKRKVLTLNFTPTTVTYLLMLFRVVSVTSLLLLLLQKQRSHILYISVADAQTQLVQPGLTVALLHRSLPFLLM